VAILRRSSFAIIIYGSNIRRCKWDYKCAPPDNVIKAITRYKKGSRATRKKNVVINFRRLYRFFRSYAILSPSPEYARAKRYIYIYIYVFEGEKSAVIDCLADRIRRSRNLIYDDR